MRCCPAIIAKIVHVHRAQLHTQKLDWGSIRCMPHQSAEFTLTNMKDMPPEMQHQLAECVADRLSCDTLAENVPEVDAQKVALTVPAASIERNQYSKSELRSCKPFLTIFADRSVCGGASASPPTSRRAGRSTSVSAQKPAKGLFRGTVVCEAAPKGNTSSSVGACGAQRPESTH